MGRDDTTATPGWVITAKGEHLRGRRVRDTTPEVTLRRAIHRIGLRFRLHRRVTDRCTADLVFPRYRVAVFVDGCYWHGCPTHGPTTFRGPNAALWQDKIETNKARDRRNTEATQAAGWTVVRIWECEIRSDAEHAAHTVAEQCRSQEQGRRQEDSEGTVAGRDVSTGASPSGSSVNSPSGTSTRSGQ
jgi:DNA mismatch endonuclease, patch repair protein